jgi:hypothetical protein
MKRLLLLIPLSLSAQVPLSLDTWYNDPLLHGSTVGVSYNNEAFRTVAAGQFRATSPTDSWVTYCTDLHNVLSSGLFTPIPLPLATNPLTQNPDWVAGGIVRATQAVAYFGGQVSTPKEAAALQLMVWELLYDATLGLASGSFRAQDGAIAGTTSLTGLWLASSQWEQVNVSAALWYMPANYLGEYRPAQGLIGDVPEAGTWGAIGVGLVAVGWVAVKRRLA